jgi:hypothetical protein
MPKESSQSAPKIRKRRRYSINRDPWKNWIRYDQLPIGKTLARELIKHEILVSALIQAPGSRRGVRLIEAASLDRYLRSLAEEQSKKPEVAAE